MKAIFQQARQTAKPVRDQLQQNREALQAAVTSGKTDAEIQQLATQQGILRGQIIAVRSQAWAKFYSLLTPEQRAQVKPVRL
jgi:Spy/CpxP family protein refolding chaperone